MAKAQGPTTRIDETKAKRVGGPGKGKDTTGLLTVLNVSGKKPPVSVSGELTDKDLARLTPLHSPRARPARHGFVRGEVTIVDDEDAASTKEKARVTGDQSAKPEGMQISEEQRKAAKGGAYLPPSRVGKRALAGHFSEETLSEFTLLAAIQSRTKQSLLDEALELLFEKHGADLAAVRRARRDRQP